jgi:hypothetical protein
MGQWEENWMYLTGARILIANKFSYYIKLRPAKAIEASCHSLRAANDEQCAHPTKSSVELVVLLLTLY